MVIDTDIIREGRSTLRQSSGLETVKNDLPPFSDKVDCCVDIDRNGGTIHARLRFEGVFELECARCLERFKHPISGDIRLIFKWRNSPYGSDEEEDADSYFDSKHSVIDLSPFIYDEIMTSLPLKPLCKDTCRGIVYEISDTAGEEKKSYGTDPRWDALRRLGKKT